jgi:DNA mismatch endonuclease (patch repair protein)
MMWPTWRSLMVDVVAPEVRSRMMAGIRGKNTKPEMIVRRGLHARGFRYILHDKRLPGKPDLVFPKYRAVIFVHGCFWHGHDCHLFKWPKTRREFWRKKIERNKTVDAIAGRGLLSEGWRCCVIWECALKRQFKLPENMVEENIVRWLKSRRTTLEIRGKVTDDKKRISV